MFVCDWKGEKKERGGSLITQQVSIQKWGLGSGFCWERCQCYTSREACLTLKRPLSFILSSPSPLIGNTILWVPILMQPTKHHLPIKVSYRQVRSTPRFDDVHTWRRKRRRHSGGKHEGLEWNSRRERNAMEYDVRGHSFVCNPQALGPLKEIGLRSDLAGLLLRSQ